MLDAASHSAATPLRNFVVWWLRTKPFKVAPDHEAIRCVGQFMGITLYREPPFQVQLFLGMPGAVVVPHAHPNFESIEVWVAGNRDHKGTYWTERGEHIFSMAKIGMDEMHGATAGEAGIAFLSIQKWREGVPIVSGELDWRGVEMDNAHAENLNIERQP